MVTRHTQPAEELRNFNTRAADADPSGDDQTGPYTGVVVIHGLGDIKRNTTLEEVVNTLAYWFNHVAGLALRREGPGSVWVSARLTDDPSPDAPAASASMRLAMPRDVDTSTPTATPAADDRELRLEFREVWWAASFGLPSVAATIAWARVQATEQAAHLLLPIGRRLGPAQTARRAPAREVRQALTYQTAPKMAQREDGERGDSTDGAPVEAHVEARVGTSEGGRGSLSRPERRALKGALALYAIAQYVWKATQWLLLTPFVLLLLLLMGLLRPLTLIPAFEAGVVGGLSRVLEYIMLHWIAEAQVYTRDYTRSAGIRDRFEREVTTFLRDERCDRLMVIAHSMGTVIAFEGLSTVLERDEFRQSEKPVTFVCLSQALRRVWLMTADDPQRLYGSLPDRVRWLHFWARYDPVCAGPLDDHALPPVTSKLSPAGYERYMTLQARLKRCENVDVINTDNVLTDHTTYWQNLEQVVGPIARELVAGHPQFERLVKAHLATADELLWRRWRIAWRASVSLAGGFAAGLGLLIWLVQHPAFGRAFTTFLGQVHWAALLGVICPTCSALSIPVLPSIPALPPNPSMQQVEQLALSYGGSALIYLATHYLSVPTLLVIALAALITGLTMTLIGRLVAEPSPLRFDTTETLEVPRFDVMFLLCATTIVLVFVASFLFSSYVHQTVAYTRVPSGQYVTAYIWALGLGQLIFWLTYAAAIYGAFQRRKWAWLVSMILAVSLAGTADPVYRTTLLSVAVAGCAIASIRAFRSRVWAEGAVQLALALMIIYAGVGTTLSLSGIAHSALLGAGVGAEYVFPLLVFALWNATPAITKSRFGIAYLSPERRAILALTPLYLGLVVALGLPVHTGTHHRYADPLSLVAGFVTAPNSTVLTMRSVVVAIVVLMSAVMVEVAIVGAWRARQGAWLAGIPVLILGLSFLLESLLELGASAYFPEWGIALSFILAATALNYALWGNPSASKSLPSVS